MADVYVVTASLLARRVKVDDEWETASIPRGTEFSEGDAFADGDPGVTKREIARWLTLRPRVVAAKADLEEAQASADAAAAALVEANAQIAELTAQLSAARAAGADTTGGSPAAAEGQPSGNASADDWRAYVKATHPELDPAEVDAQSRDDLRELYGNKSAS